jgi:hypothetical protein
MMKTGSYGRSSSCFRAISLSVLFAFVACSNDDSVTTGNTEHSTGGTPSSENGETPKPVNVSSCGTLDAAQAALLATEKLEHFGNVGLAALTALENSRAGARVLSQGNGNIVEPFVTDSQSDLHDALEKLRNEQLVAKNVESTADGSVTFLLDPSTTCKDDADEENAGALLVPVGTGGASNNEGTTVTADPDCVRQHTEHPTRVRISRIACENGDNVAIELLQDTTQTRLIALNLDGDNADFELNLGAYLLAINEFTSSEEPDDTSDEDSDDSTKVSAAVGMLRGTLVLTGTNQASAKISVTQAIDVTMANDSATRFRIAAGTDVATITADGSAKNIKLVINLGALDWRVKFTNFIEELFGLETLEGAEAEAPVDLHANGLRGKLSLDGTQDVVVAEGLDLGSGPFTALQGTTKLLSVTATNEENGKINATVAGNADNTSKLTLTNGLDVAITYGLEPVMTKLERPANYLSNDTLTVSATSGATVTLNPDTNNEGLLVTTVQLGGLLRVDSGTLTLSSRSWPSDTVTVKTAQCMSRAETSSVGHNDLLDDFTIGTCAP